MVTFSPLTPSGVATIFVLSARRIADTLIIDAILTGWAIAPVVALDTELAHIVDTQGALGAVRIVPTPILFTFAESVIAPLTRRTIRVAFAFWRWD